MMLIFVYCDFSLAGSTGCGKTTQVLTSII